ncbi:MAG: lamin tail domain-containing protein [Verrucomicrobiales bacterium]|nr:lamin tail domain-containing protein [Verrucomicrobiales bacterium]
MHNRPSALICAALALVTTTAQATPRITEFLAANETGGLADSDGDFSDWIEIHNNAASPLDLSGHYLTDDATALTKWPLPAETIPAQGYLVVFASGKNRTTAGSQLHTSFKLASDGEYLALTVTDGMGGATPLTEFAPTFPDQDPSVSYGLGSDGSTLGYFNTPTPGAANGTASLGAVADTNFSHDRGFYTAPFNLEITTATPDASIRYTTDGTTPSTTVGTLYSGAVTVNSSTTLRAIAYKNGFDPSDVDTHSYLFLGDVRTQYANGIAPGGWPQRSVNGQEFNYGMDPDVTNRQSAKNMTDALSAIPTMSVVTDQDHITERRRGFYVNPSQHGIRWERPTSLELIYPDGTKGFQVDCGIRVRGGFSRSTGNPKHALRFFFRDEYGSGKLRYPLFGNEGATEFDKFDLRTSQNYSWAFQGDGSNTFLREVLGRDIQGSMGKPYTRSRYYHLYLNGVYWGLYMTQERAEAAYGATYFGGDREDFDTIKSAGSSGGYNTEATDGNLNGDWRALWNLARAQARTPTLARYMQMQGLNPDGTRNPAFPVLLDVENLIDYTLIIGYTGNYDAPLSNFLNGASNNWYTVRNRATDDRGFAFFIHDGEHSMGAGGGWGSANDRLNTGNGRSQVTQFAKSNPGFLHWDLAGTDEYKIAFADRAYKHLNNGGVLTEPSVLAHLTAREQTVAKVIIAESARWGDSKRGSPYRATDWRRAVTSVKNVIRSRARALGAHIQRARLWPSIDPPTFNQHGGSVPQGFNVTLSNDDGTIYVTTDGSDPRLIGGATNPDAIRFDGSTTDVELFSLASDWSYFDSGDDFGPSNIVSGTAGYNASNWKHPDFATPPSGSGAAPLGYSNGVTTTVSFGGDGTNRHATTYFRTTFDIADASIITAGAGELARDDGAIVYLNGREIFRSNLPAGTVASDTLASSGVVGAPESELQPFTFPSSNFVTGTNTLAVELHQERVTSSDLSFDLRLEATQLSDVTPGVTVDAPVTVRARTRSGDEWSALTEAFFTTGIPASAANTRISEVHYHPAEPVAQAEIDITTDRDDYEFVEIVNISDQTIDLGGAAFVHKKIGDHLEGIQFTFPQGTLLPAGAYAVVVADTAAFSVRYPNTPITGDYSDRLNNTGEWITLEAADGSLIASFRYNDKDPWPTAPDGGGNSLVFIDPTVAGPDYADASNWAPSPQPGGSPASSGTGGFEGDPVADNDRDTIPALVEYYQGTSDNDPLDVFAPVATAGADGTVTFTVQRDPDVTGASIRFEVSADLETWTDSTTSTVLESTTPLPSGLVIDTYQITFATDNALRIRIVVSP